MKKNRRYIYTFKKDQADLYDPHNEGTKTGLSKQNNQKTIDKNRSVILGGCLLVLFVLVLLLASACQVPINFLS